MLVLSRKRDEKILIGDNIAITVVSIQGDKVRLGIDAPRDVSIVRDNAKKTDTPVGQDGPQAST